MTLVDFIHLSLQVTFLEFCHVLETASKSSHDLRNLACSLIDVKRSLLAILVCGAC